MTEQITIFQKLIEQSGIDIDYRDPITGYVYEGTDKISREKLQKFAELIVRECAKVVFDKTGPKSALDVLEHFGVKE